MRQAMVYKLGISRATLQRKRREMNINHGKLDGAIGDLLDRYKSGSVDKVTAVNDIAHVIQAVAQRNEAEVLTFIGASKGAE